MKEKKEVYLSGAMGCYAPDDPYPEKWREEVEKLINVPVIGDCQPGLECFNPTKFYNYGAHKEKTQREIMLYEFQRIENESDILLVNLKDLNKSIGTSDEILLAWRLNKPVIGFYEECPLEEELPDRIHPFKLCQISRIECGAGALKRAVDYVREYYGKV